MPQLPGLPLQPQEGPPVTAAAVEPTDLGLSQAADNLKPVARLLQEKDAQSISGPLSELDLQYGRQFEQGSAMYRGDTPGFAKGQIADFDAMAARMMPDNLSWGQRAAWRAGVAQLRGDWGNKAVSTEINKGGQYVAQEQRASDDNVVSLGLARFQDALAPRLQAIDKAGGYALPDYAEQRAQAFQQTYDEALQSVPEANRPALQTRLDAERGQVQADTLHARALGIQAQTAMAAQEQANRTVNAVRTDPNRYQFAIANPPNYAGLPPEEAAKATQAYYEDVALAHVKALVDQGHGDVAMQNLQGGFYDAVLKPDHKDALIKAVKTDAADSASHALEAFHWGAPVDLAQAKRDAILADRPDLAGQADWRMLVGNLEPSALNDKELLGGVGFGHAFTFTVDKLEGGGALVSNDNGHGPTKFGVNAAAHPGVDIPNLTRIEAQALAKKYWLAIGGDALPPDLALAAFSTAYNMGPEPVKQLIAQSGNDTGKFLALAEQRYRQIAAEPGQGGNLPVWMDRLAKTRQEAARIAAFVNAQDDISSDPIKYALGGKTRAPLFNVPPLPQSPADPAFAQALRGRLAIGQDLNARYHTPVRMLTNGEVENFKSQLEQNPTLGVTLAQAAMQAVGPANARQLLGEVGLHGASAQLHVADLAAAGLTTFPQAAAKGLALGAGAKEDEHKAKTLDQLFQGHAGLFAGQPDARAAIQATAHAALKADTAQGAARDPNFYFDSALGGATVNGVSYGGYAKLNGQDTVIPTWLAKDRAGDVLRTLAGGWEATGKGPVWANGTPMKANDIARLGLQLQPNGRYRLVDGQGRAMMARGGGPFEVDLDQTAKAVRAVLGSRAVRPGW